MARLVPVRTLQAHSGPLMHFIEWRPTRERSVEVLNETTDLCRYRALTAINGTLRFRI